MMGKITEVLKKKLINRIYPSSLGTLVILDILPVSQDNTRLVKIAIENKETIMSLRALADITNMKELT